MQIDNLNQLKSICGYVEGVISGEIIGPDQGTEKLAILGRELRGYYCQTLVNSVEQEIQKKWGHISDLVLSIEKLNVDIYPKANGDLQVVADMRFWGGTLVRKFLSRLNICLFI